MLRCGAVSRSAHNEWQKHRPRRAILYRLGAEGVPHGTEVGVLEVVEDIGVNVPTSDLSSRCQDRGPRSRTGRIVDLDRAKLPRGCHAAHTDLCESTLTCDGGPALTVSRRRSRDSSSPR
jgi:hypothetical protein